MVGGTYCSSDSGYRSTFSMIHCASFNKSARRESSHSPSMPKYNFISSIVGILLPYLCSYSSVSTAYLGSPSNATIPQVTEVSATASSLILMLFES